MIRKYGVEKEVIFIPKFLTNEEKYNLLNALDIFLCPVRATAFGIVFVEAMFFKKPIISYDDTAIKETIGEGGIAAQDMAGLEEAAIDLITDESKRKEMGEKGRERVLDRHNPFKYGERILSLYKEVLSEYR